MRWAMFRCAQVPFDLVRIVDSRSQRKATMAMKMKTSDQLLVNVRIPLMGIADA